METKTAKGNRKKNDVAYFSDHKNFVTVCVKKIIC